MGSGVAADYLRQDGCCVGKNNTKGDQGVTHEGITVFSCFFIGDHGVGALILSGIFELSTLTPVKGIKVSRAIMTLETKGRHRILCGSLEIL